MIDHPLQRPGVASKDGEPEGLAPGGGPVKFNAQAWGAGRTSPSEDLTARLVEELRVIKRRLLRMSLVETNPRGNVLMVTSASPGDGKSFMTLNLARSIAADQDHDVLLIDGDFKKPHISAAFGLAEAPGFLDVLAGTASLSGVTHSTDYPGLTVVAAGRAREHANELLASRRAQQLIEERLAKARDKIVVFDSSPILHASESQVLARLAGMVLLVVRAGATAQRTLAQAIQEMGPVSNCAVVLNDADVVPLSGYYSRIYGYGLGD
jgi:capsular exopolysaccharide synthesis family protein